VDEVAAGADELVELAGHEGDCELLIGGVNGGQGNLGFDGVNVPDGVGGAPGWEPTSACRAGSPGWSASAVRGAS